MDRLTELSRNKDVLRRLMKAGSPEACYKILKKNGYGGSFELLVEQAGRMRAFYEKHQAGVLTEEDMDGLLEGSDADLMVDCPFIFLLIPVAV